MAVAARAAALSVLATLGVALAAVAQPLDLRPGGSASDAQDCGSAVVLRCDRPAASAPQAEPDALARSMRGAAKRFEQRRDDVTVLDTFVVEGVAPRPATIDTIFSRNLGAGGGPASFEHLETADGRRCTCVRPCWFNCCTCSRGVDIAAPLPGFTP